MECNAMAGRANEATLRQRKKKQTHLVSNDNERTNERTSERASKRNGTGPSTISLSLSSAPACALESFFPGRMPLLSSSSSSSSSPPQLRNSYLLKDGFSLN